MPTPQRKILVTGATGFVGRPLVAALSARDETIIATTRGSARKQPAIRGVTWRSCDINDADALEKTLAGIDVAYFLVHSVGAGHDDLLKVERRVAARFARLAEKADVGRIVYLGGTAPEKDPSDHLRSRLDVGEILRASAIPTIELRSAIIVGAGGASWQITEDLARRLPILAPIPTWMMTRVSPVALDDVVLGLVAAADIPIGENVWYDLPGPEILTGWQILRRVARVHGRRLFGVVVPFITPRLTALVLPALTDTSYAELRDLVPGFRQNLIPRDARFWDEIGHRDLLSLEDAVRRAQKT